MSYTEATIQLLSPEGTLVTSDATAEYLPYVEALGDDQLKDFHRHMVVVRRFDNEATNLQRNGEMGLWVPSIGQEGAQVGSGFAARKQDHIFPAYREHAIARIRGVDALGIISMLRGTTHGGWNPAENGNFHLYTLVIGAHSLHSTGYALGIKLDGKSATGNLESDEAVIVYFGDGATSQGDVNEAMIFAASWQTPQVFFLQNNHWAISVQVTTQSRTPLYLRPRGFGIPSVQIDGNDVLASYAVTASNLDAARSGDGPRFIEALTYRIGPHTSSDDPSKYRLDSDLDYWRERDPIPRFEAYLRSRGEGDAFFEEVRVEAEDYAADIRRRTLEIGIPPTSLIFDHVYSEPHPLMDEQKAWLAAYDSSFDPTSSSIGGTARDGNGDAA